MVNKKHKYNNPRGYGSEIDYNGKIKDGKIEKLERHLAIMNIRYDWLTKAMERILDRLYRQSAKDDLMQDIEDSTPSAREKLMNSQLNIRYVGLVLVQGSSALTLIGFNLLTYWTFLWFGLLCYQISAINFYIEDNTVYRETLAKFKAGRGASQSTINALKIKRKRELVYIIGNTAGLILIGLNIITS